MCCADFMNIFTDITVCPKQMRKGQAAADHRMAGAKGFVTPHAKSKGPMSKAAMSRRMTTPQPRFPIPENTEEASTPPPPSPPPGPPRAGAKGGQGRTCPSGHLLQAERVGGKGHICDGCKTWIPPISKAAACRACDYDLCSECAASPATPLAFDPPHRSNPAQPPFSQAQFWSLPVTPDWSALASPPSFQPKAPLAMGFHPLENGKNGRKAGFAGWRHIDY